MIFLIKNGETVVNRIVSDEAFVSAYCAENRLNYEPLPESSTINVTPPTELEQIRADIDYLAAMGGIEL